MASNDKAIKKEFKAKASKDPDSYYATSVLKAQGFKRKQCSCGIFFWTVNDDQDKCGDNACSGGFRFFDNNPCKEKLSYMDVWINFSKMFKELGYTPIQRYPVVARWRDDMDFVIASIADFQPYVVSGEVEPPANPLVIPQFCLRFGDVDNVGITGSHMTCFNMIGQHMFVTPDKWDQNRVFKDIKKWLNDGLGLPDHEITFHEDAWAGGGNFGPCMEFFSRGVEIGNQVYMLYEQTEQGPKELKLKVLDMGMGMERCAWFSQGTPTIYDAVFPSVVEKLKNATGIKANQDLLKRFVPYAGMLNIDEVENIDKAWEEVAKKIGMDAVKLKEEVKPMAALYSIAEHARGLLIALNDGALPSNVGGSYNLRILARRSYSLIDKYGWNIYLPDVCRWHAEYLKPIFPELSENLDNVQKILDVEKNRYENTKQKSAQIVQKIIKQDISEQMLLELYDSNGIPPEIIREEAKKLGKEIKVPDDFYIRVSELHEKNEQVHQTHKEEKLDLEGLEDTFAKYYDDWSIADFSGKVIKIIDNKVILNNTFFYPTSGGQLHDLGTLNGEKVTDVFKQGAKIVHVMEHPPKFKIGDEVKGLIDFERRKQLAQHHSSTHIINAAAKRILGSHINQAGAKKTPEKAHIDLTHYDSLTENEIKKIEDEANKIVDEKIALRLKFMSRNDAEKKYGMTIYQGGAVPGNNLRIVEIPEVDVECCGGTHLKNTSEAEKIRILKSAKISDGIIRITFVAGDAAKKYDEEQGDVLGSLKKIFGVEDNKIPARAEELFSKWKKAKKALEKGNKDEDLELKSTDISLSEDIITHTCQVLKTQPEHLIKTVQRFKSELDEMKNKLKNL